MEPQTTNALAELLKELYADKTAWMPIGLGSRVDWGPPIHISSKKVSVKGLKKIMSYEKDDLTITVQAGLPLFELQAALAESKQWLPIDWPWGSQTSNDPESAGSIGGLIARGLSGGLRHRYLGVRDQIIGIGLLRTDGINAHAGGRVVKNVAGYDLMRLLCGSWGSLALITEITLRTQPVRSSHAILDIKGSLKNLESFRASLVSASFTPEYCDWISNKTGEWILQIGIANINKEVVADQLQRLMTLANEHKVRGDARKWEGPLIEQNFSRKALKEKNWLLRISLLPANVHKFLSSSEMQALNFWKWRIAAGTGLGDGWQYCDFVNAGNTPMKFIQNLRIYLNSIGGNLIVLTQPIDNQGRISSWVDAPSRNLIQSIKQEFDPHNQLSKGRLPGVAEESTTNISTS